MELVLAPPLMLLLEGLLYALVFGALTLLRREGLSTRFAIESVLITLLGAGYVALTGATIHPIIFLACLYLITLRVRLLVDLGNALARSKKLDGAARVYSLAAHLWPDEAGRLSVHINQGILAMQSGQLDTAIATLKAVLDERTSGYLGLRPECGCHYNLGIAYKRKGLPSQATAEFKAVLETWPTSEYARYARLELERG
jgi:tetratricopeptide (TPR) repeat protein